MRCSAIPLDTLWRSCFYTPREATISANRAATPFAISKEYQG
jgi:hypothetical protein